MKNITKFLSAATAAFALTSVASALYWEDYQYNPTFLSEDGTLSYSGTFDITPEFNPAAHTITSATASFSFSDGDYSGDSGYEHVDVFIDLEQLLNDIEVDGTHHYGFDWISGALTGTMVGSLQADGKIDFTVTIQDLVADTEWVAAKVIPGHYEKQWKKINGHWKRVNVWIPEKTIPGYWKATGAPTEDVWFKEAKLQVWGDERQVPDAGATVALLGLGLLGLAAARKRLK